MRVLAMAPQQLDAGGGKRLGDQNLRHTFSELVICATHHMGRPKGFIDRPKLEGVKPSPLGDGFR